MKNDEFCFFTDMKYPIHSTQATTNTEKIVE